MATDQTRIRNIVGRVPKTPEEIVRIAGLAPSRVRFAVEKLVANGRLRRRDGGEYLEWRARSRSRMRMRGTRWQAGRAG
jgi:hypothetical protein